MTKHTMTDDLDEAFIDRLSGEYRHVRDNHVTRLLAAAGGLGEARYLDAAFQFSPNEMSQVLFHMAFAPDDALADRARAARWYLHGSEQGWWKIAPHRTEQARALVVAHYGEAVAVDEPKTEAKPSKSRVKPHRTGQDETRRYLGIMRECQMLKAVLTDCAASNQAKLDAIEKWFGALGYLAPDDLRAAMEKIP